MRVFTDGHASMPYLTVDNLDNLIMIDNITEMVLGSDELDYSKQPSGLTLSLDEYYQVLPHLIHCGFEIITVDYNSKYMGSNSWFDELKKLGYTPIIRPSEYY